MIDLTMTNTAVTVIRCEDYENKKVSDALIRQFEFLGGLDKFVSHGDSVLLKPNFIAAKSRRCATQTDPAVILETAKLIKDFGAKPFIGDSPAWGDISNNIKKLKLDGPLQKLGVPVKQLNKPKKCHIGSDGTVVGLSSVAMEADTIINLPKFKSHQQLVATFAVKNMFGCVSGKKKAYWHFAKGDSEAEFCRLLIGIYEYLSPSLTIIDGITAMDGPGPINGRARPLGYLVAGSDPIACETICGKLINLKPEDLPIVRTARQIGFGCSDIEKITILGDNFEDNICADFEPARLIPIKFSLYHVCRSIGKQVLLLAKSLINKKSN